MHNWHVIYTISVSVFRFMDSVTALLTCCLICRPITYSLFLYSKADCGDPPPIRYASYVSSGDTLEGDVLTYSCGDNTVVEGNTKSTCQTDGTWTRVDIYCRR